MLSITFVICRYVLSPCTLHKYVAVSTVNISGAARAATIDGVLFLCWSQPTASQPVHPVTVESRGSAVL